MYSQPRHFRYAIINHIYTHIICHRGKFLKTVLITLENTMLLLKVEGINQRGSMNHERKSTRYTYVESNYVAFFLRYPSIYLLRLHARPSLRTLIYLL